jgi:hypothetical protein
MIPKPITLGNSKHSRRSENGFPSAALRAYRMSTPMPAEAIGPMSVRNTDIVPGWGG